MRYPSLKPGLLVFLFLFCFLWANGQVIGRLILLDDQETYQASIIPNHTINSPENITNTGQITLKAATGTFEIADFQNLSGIWQFNTRINQPLEAPDYDYLIFNLIAPMLNVTYEKGVEVGLFQFKNKNGCSGTIELIENSVDSFWPPNSQNANIGNQLTILFYGIDNAYHENDLDNFRVECSQELDFSWNLDSIKCHGEQATLHLKIINSSFPVSVFLKLENEVFFSTEITSVEDSISIPIPMGEYSMTLTSQTDTIQQNILVYDRTPLAIQLIEQELLGCNDPDGVSVTLKGIGGQPSSYQFSWSNGVNGPIQYGLQAGIYNITLTDKNNCKATKEINIESASTPQIDSLEIHHPSCFNQQDGIIEMLKISNGTPPFTYSLNRDKFQNENYFDQLKAGNYEIEVVDDMNCRAKKSVVLENPPELEIFSIGLEDNTVFLQGRQLRLIPDISVDESLLYEWQPQKIFSCSDCPNPMVIPSENTFLELTITNENGCQASHSQKIEVLEEIPIYIPSAFSPNGDGINDVFEIHPGPMIQTVQSLKIFNRWGQLVFDSNKNEKGNRISWDGNQNGKSVSTGVYVFFAEILLENGSSELKKGEFFLMR